MTARSRLALVVGVVLAGLLLVLPDLVGYARWGPPESARMVFFANTGPQVQREGDGITVTVGRDLEPVHVPFRRAPGRPRVLFLGESSVRRGPQGATYDFPNQVATRLSHVDCVNLGAPAANLRILEELLPKLAEVEYDLLVVYAGHNEYADVVFSGEAAALPRWELRLLALARQSYLYSALRLERARAGPAPAGAFSTSDALVPTRGPFPWQLGSQIDTNFRRALTALVHTSRAPVVLATLLRSVERPPTGLYVPPDHPACGEAATRAVRAPATAPTAEELDAACGPDHAVTAWRRALERRAAGDLGGAQAAFATMLEADPLPMRAPLGLDDAIRDVAADTGSRLVDLSATLGPMVPQALLTDVVHPNDEGARRIGTELARVIDEALAAPR